MDTSGDPLTEPAEAARGPRTFDEQLAALVAASTSTRDQGDRFEALVTAFLRQGYYTEPFRTVERWPEWAATHTDGSHQDIGIDLVATDTADGRWAIQAKCQQAPLSWGELSTFVAAARHPGWGFDRLLVVSVSDLTRAAWRECREQGIAVYTAVDFAQAAVDWATFRWTAPTILRRQTPVALRAYQTDALARIEAGWAHADRGKCIMPPGTGKTLVALRAAEAQAGVGALVLFCAPSIALVNQTILAWQRDAVLPLRFVAVTSDTTVGREEDPDRTTALVVPPTTDAATLARGAQPVADALTVVVATYQSLAVVADAHTHGLPAFAVALADEAHRTTGVLAQAEVTPSGFLLIHDATRIQAAKRLYLTATPRVFTAGLKTKVSNAGAVAVSMDDPAQFGPEFVRYPFWRAVEEEVLARYQVVVLTFAEQAVQRAFVEWLQEADAPSVPQLVRVEGLWKVLHRPDLTGPLRRAIAFVNSVAASKRLAADFGARAARAPDPASPLTYTVAHIDGTMTMAERAALLRRLDTPDTGTGLVLTNARVLTEGIDVPALDAVVFLEPRKSQVEVIQAVGRVMRRPADRPDKVGYIVVPVVLTHETAADTLAAVEHQLLPQDARFRPLIQILNALRSLDESADVKVRHLIGDDGLPRPAQPDDWLQWVFDPTMPAALQDAVRQAILPRLVEPVDNRHYFAVFGETLTAVARHLRTQLTGAVADGSGEAAAAFQTYHAALREILHPGVSAVDAEDFLIQHWILAPVFAALFPGDDLTASPVAAAFERVTAAFTAFLARERAALDDFYARVRLRAGGLRSDAERQDFLRQLFEVLFRQAFPQAAERLGIVYTPVAPVDFLNASVDALLTQHWGTTTAAPGVTVLEPFAGTGTFPVRLLDRWDPATIRRKLAARELWANDIQLFAYYLLLTNLRWTVRARTGTDPGWDLPVLWADSFHLMEERDTWRTQFFDADYTALMAAERDAAITVVLGNPPWRAGQRDENDANKNLPYTRLDARIRATYAARSTATLKNSLYDAYIRAFRWASDRVGQQGVIGFVTNAGWLDGNAMDGMRQVLAEECAAIYVVNLRGNQRTQGELSRREGGKIFGSGSRAAVALVLLVKDPAHQGPADIWYHDIGDSLSRDEKLARVAAFGDIRAVPWRSITPNAAGDWLNPRTATFAALLPLGDKRRSQDVTVFTTYSGGLKTNRDAWVYNFSRAALEANVRHMMATYSTQVGRPESEQLNDPREISWSSGLRADARLGKSHEFDATAIRRALYRPFTNQWVYFDQAVNDRVSLLPLLFPTSTAENRVIVVQGSGESRVFSCWVTDVIPDYHLLGSSQCFPRYVYDPPRDDLLGASSGWTRRDAIADAALVAFQAHYGDSTITKDALFDYVYGVLHALDYRAQFAADLKKHLPRIPFAPDFWTFSRAGRALAALHLAYETIEPYPLEEVIAPNAPSDPAVRYRVTKMRWGKTLRGTQDRTTVVVNEWITLRGIPRESFTYGVNGRSPVEWVLDQCRVKTDQASGIGNDPHAWAVETAQAPQYLVDLVKRVVRVSMETRRIVEDLSASLG